MCKFLNLDMSPYVVSGREYRTMDRAEANPMGISVFELIIGVSLINLVFIIFNP